MGTQVYPEEALEYKQQFLKLANMALEQGEFAKFARVFPWVNSIKQIEQTEPSEVFAKMMKSTIGTDIGFLVAVKRAEIDLLGHIKEGEGDEMQIHLLYRMLLKVNGNEVETIEVISLRRAEDGLLYLRVEAKSKAMLNSLLKHYENRR